MRTNKFIILSAMIALTACQDKKLEYPLDLVVHGPYKKNEYKDIQETIWTRRSINIDEKGVFDGEEVFYTLEISNHSRDTIYIANTQYNGAIQCRYFCFDFIDNKFLIPKRGALGTEYFEEWDTLMPNNSKRYITWLNLETCELLNLSLEVKSKFFDSLNVETPVRYFWDSATPIELLHPVFQYKITNGHFMLSAHQDIQKQLNNSKRKLNIDR